MKPTRNFQMIKTPPTLSNLIGQNVNYGTIISVLCLPVHYGLGFFTELYNHTELSFSQSFHNSYNVRVGTNLMICP